MAEVPCIHALLTPVASQGNKYAATRWTALHHGRSRKTSNAPFNHQHRQTHTRLPAGSRRIHPPLLTHASTRAGLRLCAAQPALRVGLFARRRTLLTTTGPITLTRPKTSELEGWRAHARTHANTQHACTLALLKTEMLSREDGGKRRDEGKED